MTALLILAGLFVASLLLVFLAVWLGARWSRARHSSVGRAVAVAFALIAVGLAVSAAEFGVNAAMPRTTVATSMFWLCILFVLQLCAQWFIIRRVLQSSAGGTWLVAGLVLASSLVMLGVAMLGVRPYLLEAYVIPTNSMAPTLVGEHRVGRCPHCGGSMIVGYTPPEPDGRGPRPRAEPPTAVPMDGICLKCLRMAELAEYPLDVHPPDRFLVDKTRTPQRWDLITYYYTPPMAGFARDPSFVPPLYVKRLVGLPGEEVFIDEGAVWIDGQKLTLPAELSGLEYVAAVGFDVQATREKPARLGAGEYFVLGDFSRRSSDSRYTGPVSAADVTGVVTVRYWPPARFHIFR